MRNLLGGLAWIGGTAILCLAGCGGADSDGLPREPVSGDVLFGGKPLERGTIRFFSAGPGAGTQVGAFVTDGAFSISKDLGPVPGDYKVEITASSTAAATAKIGEGTPDHFKLAVETIPPQYNARTTLTAKVEKAGDNRYTFDLATTPTPDDATTAKPGRRTTNKARPRKG